MEKNSDYKHNLELASRDLDDFFLGCNFYRITREDVLSTVIESLSSFLHDSYRCRKEHFDLDPGDVVTLGSEDNFFKVSFFSAGLSSLDFSCGLNTIVLTFNPVKDPILNQLKGGVKHG